MEKGLLEKIRQDSIGYLISRILPAILGYTSIYLFVKIYGIDQYGHYSYLFYLSTVISSLSSNWFLKSLLKFKFLSDDDTEAFKRTSILAFLLVICIIIVVSVGLKIFLDLKPGLMVILGLSISMAVYAYNRTYLQVTFNVRQVFIVELKKSIVFLAIPIGLFYVFKDKDYVYIAMGFLISNLSFLGVDIFSKIGSESKQLTNSIDRILIKKMLVYGIPLSLWLGLMQSFNFLDRYFADSRLGDYDLGLYSSLSDILSKVFTFLIFPITLAVHPIFAKEWEKNKKLVFSSVKRISMYLLVAFIVYFCAVYLFDEEIVYLITGEEIYDTKFVLVVISGHFLWQLALILHKPLELTEKSYWVFLALFLSFVIYLVCQIFIFSEFGLLGISICFFLAALSYCLIIILFTYFKFRKIE